MLLLSFSFLLSFLATASLLLVYLSTVVKLAGISIHFIVLISGAQIQGLIKLVCGARDEVYSGLV